MTDDALHCRGALLTPITGWFDPAPKGGFLRLAANSYLPAKGDAPVRLPGLRRGDLLTLENGRVLGVNGAPPGAPLGDRPEFAQLGAVHPSRPLSLETPRASSPRTAEIQRVVDLVCPFGFGQRALIVSPPKAGKTVMLQAVAEGVALNYPEAILLILLVDERPEEVSEMIDWGRGEVIASSFDLPYERHVAVADMVFEHARRQVELAKDVVIVLDSLTRLARSHNTTGRSSGRTPPPGRGNKSSGGASGACRRRRRWRSCWRRSGAPRPTRSCSRRPSRQFAPPTICL